MFLQARQQNVWLRGERGWISIDEYVKQSRLQSSIFVCCKSQLFLFYFIFFTILCLHNNTTSRPLGNLTIFLIVVVVIGSQKHIRTKHCISTPRYWFEKFDLSNKKKKAEEKRKRADFDWLFLLVVPPPSFSSSLSLFAY